MVGYYLWLVENIIIINILENRMFKTDILFTGYYGQKNTGDDAFVEVATWGASKFWHKNNNRFLGIESRLPKTITASKGFPFEIKGTYNVQSNILLNNTNALVYAGGSTIYRELPKDSIRLKAIQKKINGKKIKIGGIGVSIGPFNSIKDEKAVQSYLKQMDFLAVRDQASFDFVNNINNLPYSPVNAFDLAALLPEIYEYKPDNRLLLNKEMKAIGISVCRYESLQKDMNYKQEEKRNSMLINLIKQLDKNKNIHFKFYVINGNDNVGDLDLTKETISSSCPKSYEIISYTKETQQIFESIAQCDFVISTRLHAAIFACFAQIPFMLNEYHRKCTDFLNNVGYNTDYRLYNSEYDVANTANQIFEIINEKDKYIIPTKANEMQELAKLNFTAINF